jgi:hypothetical protein
MVYNLSQLGVQPSTLWSIVTIVASAIGGIILLLFTHIGQPKHAEAAEEKTVTAIEVRMERVSTEVFLNKEILDEVRMDVNEIRVEQRAYTDTILEAIRESR